MLPASDVLLRLALAALFGGMVGFERERREKPAGLRTHMIVSTASALMMVVTADLFPSANADVLSRVVAGVLTGIGFIGAGTIMRHEDHVQGLTTAASVWAVGALGVAIGLGYYAYGIYATTILLGILLLGGFERRIREYQHTSSLKRTKKR